MRTKLVKLGTLLVVPFLLGGCSILDTIGMGSDLEALVFEYRIAKAYNKVTVAEANKNTNQKEMDKALAGCKVKNYSTIGVSYSYFRNADLKSEENYTGEYSATEGKHLFEKSVTSKTEYFFCNVMYTYTLSLNEAIERWYCSDNVTASFKIWESTSVGTSYEYSVSEKDELGRDFDYIYQWNSDGKLIGNDIKYNKNTSEYLRMSMMATYGNEMTD